MKNGLWIVVVIVVLFVGVLAGFTARSYYVRHQISKVPRQVNFEDFKTQILNKVSNAEHKKYIINLYSENEDNYILKTGLDVSKKDITGIYNILEHYNIIKSVQDLVQPEAESDCGESAGY
jgi:predicted negative regulator of RcsB-dependent stress response